LLALEGFEAAVAGVVLEARKRLAHRIAALDAVPFGVEAMTEDGVVTGHHVAEARLSGLSAKVVGRHFFSAVAQCTNNFMVAHRFETEPVLDAVVDLSSRDGHPRS
jgi:hypothetical protein